MEADPDRDDRDASRRRRPPDWRAGLTTTNVGTVACLCLAAFALVPFVVAFRFIHPSWDDPGFHLEVGNRGLLGAQVLWYMVYSGRYASDAIVSVLSLSIHQVWLYRLLCLAIFLTLIASVHGLLRATLRPPRVAALAITGMVISSFLVLVPGVAEGVYWLTGAGTYTLGTAFLFFTFTSMLASRAAGGATWPTAAWIAVTVGMNEVFLLLLLGFLTFVIVRDYVRSGAVPRRQAIWLGVTIACSIASLAAPGNWRRLQDARDVLEIPRDLSTAIVNAAKYLMLDLYYLVQVGALPFLLLAAVALAGRARAPEYAREWRRELVAVPYFLLVFYGVILFFTYAQGIRPIPRVTHAIYLPLLVFSTIFVVRLSAIGARPFRMPAFALGIVLLGLALGMTRPGSGVRRAYSEWLRGDWHRYDAEVQARARLVQGRAGEDVIVPRLGSRPTTIFVYDISANPALRHNTLYAHFYGVRSIATAPDSSGADASGLSR